MDFRDTLLEKLKFPFYSRQEVEIENAPESSQTSKPENLEQSYVTYDPFGTYSNNQLGQLQVLSANKNEMIRKWRESSYLSKVDTALGEICNESIVYDEVEDPIKINLSDIELPDEIKTMVEDSFDNILYMLDFNERGDDLFKQWYVDGQLNIEVVYDNSRLRDGINKLLLISPFNFNQFIDEKSRTRKYYYGEITNTNIQQKIKNNEEVYTEEQICHINSGIWSMDKKFPISPLNKAMKPINQLNLIEDSLVIARITKSTEKRAFFIPTGNLNKAKAEEYMRSLINKYRQKKVYNTDSGTVENRNRSISVLEDFWFPVGKDGTGPRVENLAGTAPGFVSFEDVDYFVNEVYKSLNIPLNRRAPDSRQTLGNTVDIEKDELKFFKMILKLRRRFNNIFIDLLKKDVLAKRIMSLEDWNLIQEKIKFTYANSNEYSEIKNNQIMSMRVDSATSATQLIEGGLLSKKYIQTNILRLTEEEIQEIAEQNAIDAGEALNKQASDEFGGDYTVTPRSNDVDMGGGEPEEESPEIPSETGGAPTGGAPEAGAPEAGAPTMGAAESFRRFYDKDKLIVENVNPLILQNLEEGDIISDGNTQLRYTNGLLERV